MKTFVRTTTTTTIIVLSVLVIGAYTIHLHTKKNAQAAPAVPANCSQPELSGIQELLSKRANQNNNQSLIEKKKSLEQAELDCIARTNTNPPAQKPKELVGVLLPTQSSAPVAITQTGIQIQELLPIGTFIPASDQPNYWIGFVKGKVIEITAGYLREQDENWQQNHPEWINQGPQGALYIVIGQDGANGTTHPTPSRNGGVYFASACGKALSLIAADGTVFNFDVETLSYVENTIPCATP